MATATGNISQRSKQNLDEYINFFDSSVVLGQPSSELKHEVTNDHSMSQVENDEHTTTKKRQGRNTTAVLGADHQSQHPSQFMAAPNSSHMMNTTTAGGGGPHQANVMQSPLASYLNRAAHQGTSASFHQAISVLSDYKDHDQIKTIQKRLQSPPEFASPLDTYGQYSNHNNLNHVMFQNNTNNSGQLEPILESSSNQIALNSSTKLNSHFNNVLHQQKASFSGNMSHSYTYPSQYPNFNSSSQLSNGASKDHHQFNNEGSSSNKMSFAQFYEKTVSPLNNSRHKHSNSQSKFQTTQGYMAVGPSQLAHGRPLTSTKKRGSLMTAAAEASMLACEQMMEQIAAIIDYDINDYLPPNSAGQTSNSYRNNRTPQTSSFKNSTIQQQHYSYVQNVHKRSLVNNYVQTGGGVGAACALSQIQVSQLGKFSAQNKENQQRAPAGDGSSKKAQLFKSKRGHNSTHHVMHHSSLTVDQLDEDEQNKTSLTESDADRSQRSKTNENSYSKSNQRQRHQGHQRSRTQSRNDSRNSKLKKKSKRQRERARHLHQKTSSNELRVSHSSPTEPSSVSHSDQSRASSDDDGDNLAPDDEQHQHHTCHNSRRHQGSKKSQRKCCNISTSQLANRKSATTRTKLLHRQNSNPCTSCNSAQQQQQPQSSKCCQSNGSKSRNRFCRATGCSGSNHISQSNHRQHHHNFQSATGAAQHMNNSRSYWSRSHRDCSQEQLSFNSSIDANDRQKLAMMILQGDQSVQIIKQDTASSAYPNASPRFQLQISQSAQNTTDRAQISLLQSLINPSDFQQMVRNQPGSSRNRVQSNQNVGAIPQSSHIYVSGGDSRQSPDLTMNNVSASHQFNQPGQPMGSHSRHTSVDTINSQSQQHSSNYQQQQMQQQQQMSHLMIDSQAGTDFPPTQRLESRLGDSHQTISHIMPNMTNMSNDLVHLTTINAGQNHQISSADTSQHSNTIHEINQALDSNQPAAANQATNQNGMGTDAAMVDPQQTSFSQLYQPYNHAKLENAPDQMLQQKEQCQASSASIVFDVSERLTANEQLSYASSSLLAKDKAEVPVPTPLARKQIKRKKKSLIDCVIYIQRAYRAFVARRECRENSDHENAGTKLEETAVPLQQCKAGPAPDATAYVSSELTLQKEETEEEKKRVDCSKSGSEVPANKQPTMPLQIVESKSLKSTQEAESSDIELPDMFEYDNWWIDAEKPMTDECLTAFLKKHL